jgi:hypothetical protein
MRAAAGAFALEFLRRHRWGFAAVAAYLVLLATGVPASAGSGMSPRFAWTVLVPVTIAFFYFLAVFSFGFAGDLAARQSMYPARLFTLPLTNAALAGWPMLYGMSAMIVLWAAVALFSPWPPWFEKPILWPGVFGAALLGWTQTLTWMPYGLRGLRVIAAVLLLTTIDAVVFTSINDEVAESTLLVFLIPQIPLTYLCARAAVSMARRGEVPDWRGSIARPAAMADGRTWPRRFVSAATAQRWFDWRERGWPLVAWIAILLPFETVLLRAIRDTPRLVIATLIVMLITPPFMAAFAVATAGGPFTATRPMTTSALVAAKLQVAALSTAAAWLLILAGVPLALWATDTWAIVVEQFRRSAEVVGLRRAVAVAVLAVSGLALSTWKQLVQGLCIGLSGREWLIKGSVFARLSLGVALIPFVEWALTPSGFSRIWDLGLWILGVLAVLKTAAACWIVDRLDRSNAIDHRVMVVIAAIWMFTVLMLYAVLVWLVSTPPLVPRYVPAAAAILAIPLVRPLAAPLALAWHRHR